jgi:hypothetical protein
MVTTAAISLSPGTIRYQLLFSTCCMTAGVGGLAGVTPGHVGVAVGLATLAGIGIGGLLWPTVCLAVIASPDEYIATITATNLALRLIGGAVKRLL